MEVKSVSLVEVRPSIKGDISALQDRLKQTDVDEVMASHGLNSFEALTFSFIHSPEKYTILIDGQPEAIFGVVKNDQIHDWATIWLLGSDNIEKISVAFIKICRKYIKMFFNKYNVLYNHIDVRNQTSYSWLKYLGATFNLVEKYGYEQKPFNYFELRKESANV
jgi:hypothetical protein